jgi:tetratricopeptide (TPR) repeat protein
LSSQGDDVIRGLLKDLHSALQRGDRESAAEIHLALGWGLANSVGSSSGDEETVAAARNHLRQALYLSLAVDSLPIAAQSHYQLAMFELRVGNKGMVADLLSRLPSAEENMDPGLSSGYAFIRAALAFEEGDLDLATRLATQAREAAKKVERNLIEAQSVLLLASIQSKQGNASEANTALDEAISILRGDAPNDPLAANALVEALHSSAIHKAHLATHLMITEPINALNVATEAAEVLIEIGTVTGKLSFEQFVLYLYARLLTGQAKGKLGDLLSARPIQSETKTLATKLLARIEGESPDAVQTLRWIETESCRWEAEANLGLGDVTTAVSLAQEAARLISHNGNILQMAWLRMTQAEILRQQAEFIKARECLLLAGSAFKAFGEESSHADAMLALGRIQKQCGKYAEARMSLNYAIEGFKLTHDVDGEGIARELLGRVNLELGESEQAEKEFTKAFRLLKTTPNLQGYAGALFDLARMQLLSPSRGTLGIDNLNEATKLADELQNATLSVNCELLRAIWRFRQGDLSSAKTGFQNIVSRLSSPIEANVASSSHYFLSKIAYAEEALATALWEAWEAVRLAESFRAKVGGRQSRASVLTDLIHVYDWSLLLSAEAAQEDVPGASSQVGRTIEVMHSHFLSEALRTDIRDVAESSRRSIEQILELEHAIGERVLEGSPHSELEMLTLRLKEATEELTETISEEFSLALLGNSFSEPDGVTTLTSRHTLMFDLVPDKARIQCITYWRGPEDREEVVKTTLSPSLLDTLIESTGNNSRSWEERDHQAWAALSKMFLPEGLIRALKMSGEGPLDIVMVPSGPLWAFPFAVLPVDGRPLIALARLLFVPSLGFLSALQSAKQVDAETEGVVGHFHPRLPGALDEQRWLGKPERALGPFTECHDRSSLIRALSSERRSRIATIACHGDSAAGLDQSLWLGDGSRLSAGALLGLHFPPLVVLGACWSARQEASRGLESLGLAIAVLSRGARGVIGGRSALEDKTTSTVLVETYRGIELGLPAPEALRVAQLKSSAESRSLEWANLIYLGVGTKRL